LRHQRQVATATSNANAALLRTSQVISGIEGKS
jgi:hypothetical protein